MRCYQRTSADHEDNGTHARNLRYTRFSGSLRGAAWFLVLTMMGRAAIAQVNVVTAHNDIARTGQNLNETILKPSNVNTQEFGKIFSQNITGNTYSQPLYVSNVAIPNKGTHNVVYVTTDSDYVYAFDGDNNGGVNATPLWSTHLWPNNYFGVVATPVIDLPSKTLYVVSSDVTLGPPSSGPFYHLHALDITTGAEKFGGPTLIQGSVPGTGSGSVGGVLTFNPEWQSERAGMLLLNGVLYVPFGSIGDNGPWHGWLFSYNASTLQPINVFCTSPNGSGVGIWMGGAGLSAEVNNPMKPYGRMFVPTGNGSYSPGTQSYGMTILDLDLSGGVPTVKDQFTPYNQALLDGEDGDVGSGGAVLLPTATLASGKKLNSLAQVGKSGMIYILDRDNNNDGSNNPSTEYSPAGMGGFNASGDQVFHELQTPVAGGNNWGEGVWGAPAYWNNNLYFGGTNLNGGGSSLTAYSFIKGVLSAAPTSQSADQFLYPGPTPSVSASGTTNGIVWALKSSAYYSGTDVLFAYDATNLGNVLYSSNTNLARDNPGQPEKSVVPTIANGKVYVPAFGEINVYGLLGATPTVAPPVISPSGATFTGSQKVTITDATSGAQIYYTTNGSTPTVKSALYNPSTPINVTTNETITAIASATGYLQGAPVSAVFSSTANAANPVFSLGAGSYSGKQSLSITDATAGAKIYYTVDGSTPTTASTLYTGKFSVPLSETVQAVAIAPSLLPSSIVAAAYDIDPAYTFDFSQGFAQAQSSGQMKFNGSTGLDDFRLQLTNGGYDQAGSAFYSKPVPIWAFTTDFTFQLSNPVGDGITFTIQGDGPTALGSDARDLGYGGISNSIAIKFDIYNNVGEGNDSTGLYIAGNTPTLPSIDLTKTGINLRSGDYMNVHMTYDDRNLNITITDAITLATWSHSWVVNIPQHIGNSTGYVGFTGGTGGVTASQKITSWTYLAGIPAVPNYPAGFDPVNGSNILALNGKAALSGTNLELTSGSTNQSSSAYYVSPVDITAFASDFDFIINKSGNSALGDGLTFVIQNAGPTALGTGAGGLGYASIPLSLAIKFDDFNNAGEGNASTGTYTDGSMPTLPATTLTGSAPPLCCGVVHVHITYNGTTLTWQLTNPSAEFPGSFTGSVAINIPQTLGSNTGYVGFTGSSGPNDTSIEQILDWTFSNP